ncbi:MAG: LytR/AlgR family response regulator transcription factor [Flavobacteriaceae bacterium]
MKTVQLDVLLTKLKRNFWLCSLLSWTFFGFILFLSGFSHQSFASTLVRNGLFILVGFSLSFLLRFSYKYIWEKYSSIFINGVATSILSFLCGVISGMILNPITFYGFRGGLGDEPLFTLFAGVLNFSFVFMIWSAGYYIVKNHFNPFSEDKESTKYLWRIPVDLSKEILLLKTEDITHIKSDGDYVNIFSGNKSYLLRKSLSSILKQLNPDFFQRIHRSTVVNTDYIKSLKPHTNGEYFLILSDGTSLKLSRSYKHVLKRYLEPTK